jgi:hypothetical protein
MCSIMYRLRLTTGVSTLTRPMPCITIPAPVLSSCGESQQPPQQAGRALFVPTPHKGTNMSRIRWVNLIPYPNRVDYPVGKHCVYLVYAGRADLYKIGWTSDLHQRLLDLPKHQRDIPGPYRLVHSIETECGRFLERQLHLLFHHRHSIREWYRLTRMDVAWFIALGTSLPDGISTKADVVPPLAEWTN